MFDISQHYGIKLKKLYSRNRMEFGTQPAKNEQVKMSGCKVKKRPKLRSEVQEEEPPPFIEADFLEEEMEEELPPIDTLLEIELIEELEEEIPDEEPDEGPEETLPEITPQDSTQTSPELEEIPNEIEEDPFGEEENEEVEEEPEVIEEVTPAPPANQVFHTVAKGDTLWNISRRYNTTVDAIKKLNSLSNNVIRLGQKLRVK